MQELFIYNLLFIFFCVLWPLWSRGGVLGLIIGAFIFVQNGRIIGLAVDVRERFLFWSDVSLRHRAIYRGHITSTGTMVDVVIIIHKGKSNAHRASVVVHMKMKMSQIMAQHSTVSVLMFCVWVYFFNGGGGVTLGKYCVPTVQDIQK